MTALKSLVAVALLLAMVTIACGSADSGGPINPASLSSPARLTPPNDEPYWATYFEDYGTNAYIATEDLSVSTFAMDVDTASYTVARSYLTNRLMPPKDSVRVEEFVNYFEQEYPPSDETFQIRVDGAQSPFGEDNKTLLRIGVVGKDAEFVDRKPAVLTFVVDVSGSMDIDSRLGLAKRGLEVLLNALGPDDRVGIVVYGSNARRVLDPTSDHDRIRSAIRSLRTEGTTNAEAGLRLGYQMATEAFEEGRINRVILVSDGVANVGRTGPDSILEVVRDQANRSVTLTTIGVGMENFNDVLMERLANDGDGSYFYLDTDAEARDLFGRNLFGVLQVIARDAKIQVEFNPETVDRYRLIGYENRQLDEEDFRDDTVDAGEVGVGHTVTALYELRINDDAVGDVAEVRVRYVDADTGVVEEISADVTVEDLTSEFDDAAPQFRFTAAVAEFAEILRESAWAADGSLSDVLSVADSAAGQLEPDDRRSEFLQLVRMARNAESER